ncbi:type II secretion system F family protein [Aminicella lysinilytica]|uniref:Tight adherence protein B n=1 Tax=Aminicella lysinilytica TaxID=433323 RepID=A0A4R6Q607_9FIRM|nr:type II secretion system F family protein [Aminicella lysinilytica]TDP57465.1 tight adherence protein B [Aminicella lysinilytica]
MGIDYSKYELSKPEKEKLLIGLVVTTTVVGVIFYNSIFFAVATVFLFRPAQKVMERFLAKKRLNELRLQFKDFLYSLSSSLATGRHMEESLEEARKELLTMYKADDHIIRETEYMLHSIKDAGEPDIVALEDLAARARVEDIDIFVQVYRACRETGGDMISAVNKSAAVIGEKITIENEIQVMSSQKKFEGKIITAMPVGIILFLRVMSPDYLSIMYQSLAGRLMMTAALAATIGAYALIERITDIEV